MDGGTDEHTRTPPTAGDRGGPAGAVPGDTAPADIADPAPIIGRFGVRLIVGLVIAVVALAALTLLDSPESAPATVVWPGDGSGWIGVVLDDDPLERVWGLAWDGNVETGDVLQVELVGACECEPRSPRSTAATVVPVVAMVGGSLLFAGLVLAASRLVARRGRVRAQARREAVVAGPADRSDALRIRPGWIGDDRLRTLWFEAVPVAGEDPAGWLPVALDDPDGVDLTRTHHLVGDGTDGSPHCLVPEGGGSPLLASGPMVTTPPGAPHPGSGVVGALRGWEGSGPEPSLIAAAVATRRRMNRLGVSRLSPGLLVIGIGVVVGPALLLVPVGIAVFVAGLVVPHRRSASWAWRPLTDAVTVATGITGEDADFVAGALIGTGLGVDQASVGT